MSLSESLVLVVEDDADIRFAVCLILEQLGVRVRAAPNGQVALASVKEVMPTLIFLDMRMPVMDGWEFARIFRREYGRSVPIIVLTAAANAEHRAAEISADGWISKPFEIDSLIKVLKRFGVHLLAA